MFDLESALTHGITWPPRRQAAFLAMVGLVASLFVLSPTLPRSPTGSGSGTGARVVEGYGELPISFEPNVGQAPSRYDFVARGRGFGMAIDATGATLALGAEDIVRLELLGARRSAQPRALAALPGKVNYFIGDDPTEWHRDVSTFGRVSYNDVLEGIDVTYYGTNGGTLEYDFVVGPGVDPNDIRLGFSGASDLALRDGNLVILTPRGAVTQAAPVLYQTIGGRRVPVTGRFALEGHEVGFEVGTYDHSRRLVIDPTLVYSTFLGGTGDDKSFGIAVDSSGAAYVTGSTTSSSFPTPSFPGFGGYAGQLDAFVTKLNAAGSALVYSTYLGGTKMDFGYGIAVDSSGAAYVTGSTTSADFPTSAPIQASNAGSEDAFVTKLNPSGSALVYSTYLGGSNGAVALGVDIARGIAVDGTGAAYVTGSTTSTDFPTQVPFQPINGGGADAFVTKINDKGSGLLYSTYLGGVIDDRGNALAIDSSGAAYVTGSTTSANFPLQAPFQATNGGGDGAFVTKLNAAGSAPIYSTYLGGSAIDVGFGIDVDGAGAAYVTGSTSSTNFPTVAPIQGTYGGSFDAFVTKLSAAGSTLIYSTYLGAVGSDSGNGIAVDAASFAYVTGYTGSAGFPLKDPFQATNGGMLDAFVTKLNPSGSAFVYSTFLGGSDTEFGNGIALDGASAAYVTGSSRSSNFPLQIPLQGSNAGLADGFVTKLKETPPAPCDATSVVTIQVAAPNQTTYGTAGADVIRGTSGVDTIYGVGGNDTICGLGGNDKIDGGAGADLLYGDSVYGGTGKDLIHGGVGADRIYGNNGVDTLYGDDGADKLYGNDGADSLYGGIGNDELSGFDGDDTLIGGDGNDVLWGGNARDFLNGGNGADKL
ncbi:MAG: hypothetical protein GEU71_15895, partial [Actinobacteria bacterium]|nr:hypothetical protein [Actinomycetota bacterium]